MAPRPPLLMAGPVAPIDTGALFTLLEEDPDIQVVDHVRADHLRGPETAAARYPACPPVAVVRMPRERAAALAANPQVIVEADQPLTFNAPSPLVPAVAAVDPALAVPLISPDAFTVRATGSGGVPVPGAHVWAVGAGWPAHAVTDPDGRATLVMPAGTAAEVCTLLVRPVSDYWPVRVDNPALPEDGQERVVELRPLSETFEGFPEQAIPGWGRQAMRLNQLPPNYRGHGITIALLDSGISTAHPDLKEAVTTGRDFVSPDPNGWETDATGHGTACAGVIAAADNRIGITGIAAEAELHSLKLHPGGRVSHLLRALDWCMAHDVDVAQINLFCPTPSALVALKIHDARNSGTVCVAPAGDDGTTVAFPASLPDVLAVGALGLAGSYPSDTPHAAHTAGRAVPSGPYVPAFSPLGPGVDLTAPGVAVITTSPGDGYLPYDGTAVAAAHITGLAALVLAHHDAVRTQPPPRSAARADQVYAMLRASCRPLPAADPARTGAGLPDAPTTLGLRPAPALFAGAAEAVLASLQAEIQRGVSRPLY